MAWKQDLVAKEEHRKMTLKSFYALAYIIYIYESDAFLRFCIDLGVRVCIAILFVMCKILMA